MDISQELQEKVRAIKGNRTVREMAKDTNLSTATLSRYMTGHGRGEIKIETLRKICSEESNPQADIRFSDLLDSACYGRRPVYRIVEQSSFLLSNEPAPLKGSRFFLYSFPKA